MLKNGIFDTKNLDAAKYNVTGGGNPVYEWI